MKVEILLEYLIYKSAMSIISDQEMCERESRKIAQGSLVYKINSVDNSYTQCYIWEFMTVLHDTEEKRRERIQEKCSLINTITFMCEIF